MIFIAVDYSTGRELIIVFFSVQGFFYAAVILLAFFVSFPVFKKDAFLIFFPVIPVIGIQMALVEAEFRQQHGMPRELVKII